MSNDLLTVRQAAEALGLHPRKVTRLIRSGEIRAFKAFDGLRAPWLIPADQVAALKAQDAA